MWYWSVAILFWQLSIDYIVNGQCKRCGFAKTRLRHPSLPFDSLPYPTRTICRRVHSVSHVTTKRKEVEHILWVWGSVPRVLRARGSPARNCSVQWAAAKECLVKAYITNEIVSKTLLFLQSDKRQDFAWNRHRSRQQPEWNIVHKL